MNALFALLVCSALPVKLSLSQLTTSLTFTLASSLPHHFQTTHFILHFIFSFLFKFNKTFKFGLVIFN